MSHYTIVVDLGRTIHRLDLPPWIDSLHEARAFRHACCETWSVEPVVIDGCYLGVVQHEGTFHGLTVPALDWEQACEVLEAVAGIGDLIRVTHV
jgi:hypothetical protein